jgi:hypothetical protein
VHHAELAGGPGDAPHDGGPGPEAGPLLELTSSGMTHSCASAWWGAACARILAAFTAHRVSPAAFATQLNWGSLEVAWGAGGAARVEAAVRDARGSKVRAAPAPPAPPLRPPPGARAARRVSSHRGMRPWGHYHNTQAAGDFVS